MYSLWAIFLFAAAAYSLDLPECKHHECVEYKVIEKRANYEVRRYESYKIATATSKGVPVPIANMFNFRKLFKYISGSNEQHKHMKMTIPVMNIINMNKKTGQPIIDETELGFFMSKKLDGEPPKPTDETVVIKDFGPVNIYAVTFGGYTHPWAVYKMHRKLHDDLKRDGVEFDESFFVVTQYNKPTQFFNRHNDLFYMATEL